MMQVVYQNNYVTIRHNVENKLLLLSWQDYYSGDEYIMVMKEMLKLSRKYGIRGWLIDCQQLGFVLLANTGWIVEVLGKQISNSTVRKIARLRTCDESNEEFLKIKVNQAISEKHYAFRFRVFDQEREALDWLKEPIAEDAILPQL